MKTNGIVALSDFEIGLVAGGKSVVDRWWESIARWLDGLANPPGTCGVPLMPNEIQQLALMFDNIGGSIAQTGSLADGTVNIRLTGSDGTYTFVNVTGIR